MKKFGPHYLSFAFCAFLSVLALVGLVSTGSSWWQPAFFAFLPMCFFYAASNTARMQQEIVELRGRLAALEQKPAA